eukprot:365707-Chlamydomonas_euryale.AAC.35
MACNMWALWAAACAHIQQVPHMHVSHGRWMEACDVGVLAPELPHVHVSHGRRMEACDVGVLAPARWHFCAVPLAPLWPRCPALNPKP